MSSGGRFGRRPRAELVRLTGLAAGRRPRAGAARVPERAGDRPPLVVVGTHYTFALRAALAND
jgi:hypothetical protein